MDTSGCIMFIITREQQEQICEHFHEDINELEDWQIQELLDKLIDEQT